MVHSKALGDEELIDYARGPGMVLINRATSRACGALHRPQQPSGRPRPRPAICWSCGHRHIAFLSSDHAIEDALLRHQAIRTPWPRRVERRSASWRRAACPMRSGWERAMLNLLGAAHHGCGGLQRCHGGGAIWCWRTTAEVPEEVWWWG